MIIDKEIKIKVNIAQIKHFKGIGLDFKPGDEVTISPNQLSPGSNIKILCECDVCGTRKKHTYRRYLRSVNNCGYYSCSIKCAQGKSKATYLEKYGEDHHFKSEQTKNKIKSTFKLKYGSEHFSHSEKYMNDKESIVKKRKKTINKKYMEDYNVLGVGEFNFRLYCENHDDEYLVDKRLYHNRKRCNVDTCVVCFPLNENASIKELELGNFIEGFCDIKRNYRINNNEIDVYVERLGVGFEFNGLYWHNEQHKPNDYHLNKTKFFESNGIKLIHIYGDDWDNKIDIVKSRILNILGKSNKIYGRKCEIRNVCSGDYRSFLKENHIQGNTNTKIKLGLYYNDELVSVMGFGPLRKSLGSKVEGGSYEMLRFCNKLNTSVIGGASKLFKYFIKTYNPIKIISYADRSWSDGSLYRTLGFTLSHETKPNYYYIINKIRYNRYGFRKDVLIKNGFDQNKTERQIMIDRGIHRIYDSGSLVFTYHHQS